jgi:DNA-binding MarR family transcriptional regulator
MKNKTVIRKENKKGQFTTIHHSILKDKRLSSNGFRLLVNILSDSDEDFKLSPTVYCNRLGISKTTFLNAIKNLEECGYLKREDSKIDSSKNYYTISEFGNLKKEPSESITNETKDSFEQDEAEANEIKDSFEHEEAEAEFVSEYSDEFLAYVKTLDELIKYEEFGTLFIGEWMEKLKINTVVELKKKVDEYLKEIYKENLALAKNSEKYPKALIKYKEWLKDEIFNKHNLDINAKNKWAILSLIKFKKPYKTDYETLMGDYYENPKD